MKTITNNKGRAAGLGVLLPLCAVFFSNPTVRLVDILPDFIACFVIAAFLGHAAARAPFFAEAREGFIKLGIVSLCKIPAFVIENSVRAGNVSDFDITVLLTFSFSVIEGILFFGIIKDLFSALFYLGERSDMSVLLTPFPISKRKGSRVMSVERLRALSLFCVFLRLAAAALPEFLLLTRTTDSGAHVLNIRAYYPYAVVLAVILSLIGGIIFAKRWCAYIRALRAEGGFFEALDGLVDPSAVPELERKLYLSRLSFTLNLLIFSTVFIFSLRFDNLSGVNLIPTFGLGLFMTVAALRLVGRSKLGYACLISGIVYSAVAFLAQLAEFNFLNKYTLEMLARDEGLTSEYLPTVILEGVSIIPFLVLTSLVAVSLYKLLCERWLTDGGADDIYLKARRRSMAVRCCLWVGIGAMCALSRFFDLLFNLYSDITIVSREDGIGGMDFGNVTLSLVPWFGTLVFALSVLYVGYTVYLASKIKEDRELYEK